MAAVLLPLLVGLTGLAVDVGNIYVAHSKLQAAVDAGALAGSLQLPYDPKVSNGKVVAAATQVFNENFKGSTAYTPTLGGVVAGTEVRSVCVDASVTVDAMFIGALEAIGASPALSTTITADACAGFNNLEVVLVIDNTGSMKGTPIAKVNEASINLVDLILPDGAAPSTKVGLVPFRGKVHLASGVDGLADGCRNANGTLNTGLPKKYWINAGGTSGEDDGSDDPRDPNDGSSGSGQTKTGRVMAASSGGDASKSGRVGGDPSSGGTDDSSDDGDPRDPNGGSGDDGTTGEARLPSGVSADTCSSIPRIQALTTNKTQIINAIKTQNCLGNASGTVISEGVKWGAQVLSQAYPYTEGGDKEEYRKVMIVLTDGDTEDGTCGGSYAISYTPNDYWTNAYYGMEVETCHCNNGGCLNQALLDAATAAKAQGIEIFAIRYGSSDTTDISLMKAIASSKAGTTDHYYNAPSAYDIPDIFAQIGRQLGWRLLN
jgi:Flp pilus assembly protein TadG